MEKAGRLLLQPSVSGVTVSLLVSGLTVDVLSTLCNVFLVHCVKLMLIIFKFGVLLFDCLSPKRNKSETFYQVWALHR